MSALARLAAARRALRSAMIARALLWGASVALAVLAVGALAEPRVGGVPGVWRWLALGAGLAVAAALAARDLRRATLPAVALWVEERVPGLDYALVTLAESPGDGGLAALEARAARVLWAPAVGRAASRALVVPLLAVAIGVLLVRVAPAGATRLAERARATGTGAMAAPGAADDRLAALTVRVTPPAYARRAASELREPSSVTALVGSAILVAGRGGAEGLAGAVGERAVPVSAQGSGWAASLRMPAKPAALRLRDGVRERWIVLVPVPDSAPAVTLTAPARDTVFRTPQGALPLAAVASDDVGLARGGFEYIVSSGEGESFTFRSGVLGTRTFGGARRGELAARLDLAAITLAPGDVVHVRAVAGDANTVSGPGVGASETRALRIARAGEYDSVAVEGAPPPEADKSLVSQRMLILLTEALEKKRPRLARDDVVREARRIAVDQKRLRKAVGEIVFARLGEEPSGEHEHAPGDDHDQAAGEPPADSGEALLRAADAATGRGMAEALDFHGDETPVVAVNRPLLEAYNAMWDAGRELDAGEPKRALPPMRLALAAIQRARAAERIYLRGRAPDVIVDIAKVRLAGKPEGSAAPRAPREPAGDAARDRQRRLARALAALPGAPASALDSLLTLRVDALDGAPALAAALGEAMDLLRAGRDATAALSRARELAGGEAAVRAELPRWSGGW